jgi:glycosyltransferase involved in cell wall biosynthesis
MRILFIAPGNNVHTWKWVGWFGRKYPGEIGLIPYQAPPPENMLDGVTVFKPYIPLFRIMSIDSWMQFGRVRKIVHETKPALLHAMWAYGSGLYAARCDYHPFVLSPWGSDVTIYPNRAGLKGRTQRRFVLEALRKADRVTATSRFLSDAIAALLPDRGNPEIFPYGVDTSVFDPQKISYPLDFNWPADAPQSDAVTVGFFKSLETTYGPDILLKAIAIASKKDERIRCVIGGSGTLLPALRKLADSLGISDRVCFAGLIKHSDMPSALAGIDIFAMPSRYEVLGVAALEASSMAKPVIVAKKWGMVEVMEDKVTGLFMEPENPDDLAQKILTLARDPELRNRMGTAGREFVKKKYEFESIMESADRFCAKLMRSG